MPAERLRGTSIVCLHLVRELTRRFGGEVEVDSVKDQGTTFTVTIPVPASVHPDPQHPEMSSA